MDDVAWVGEDAGADVGEGDDGTYSYHLSVLRCILRNLLDLAQVLTCLECAGGKQDQLKRGGDVQRLGNAKWAKHENFIPGSHSLILL
jgi:hypothetical protein